ncbi:MAG: homogentisate 1,2-dioxygenase [Ectothiorhodospiraceae bacterium]|nr:homogentisate 1,2-dioxygenase [Ectothiorhodospiraceae bacterium]
MPNWITMPHTEGISSRQAHTNLPKGTYERELGKLGFTGPSTHMYHHHPPTNWSHIEGTLIHRAFDTHAIDISSNSPWNAAQLLTNQYLSLRMWHCLASMNHLVRNADGDDLLFVHKGSGDFFCDYGHLHFQEGDYIMIPKGTMWRIVLTPSSQKSTEILMIEAIQLHYQLPDKGLIGHHAIFDSAVLDVPKIDDAFVQQQGENEWCVVIKRLNTTTDMVFPYNPLDAVGWHGTLMPVKINWRDIRPIMSHRYHVPPSAHTLFLTDEFIVSTFVPRPMESEANVLRVPFYHSNDDYDEVIFYHQGNFFSRDSIEAGMITLHPSGIPHGPHPKAYAAGQNYERKETDEVAVMIDSRAPLTVSETAVSIEKNGYVNAWKQDK